MRTPLQILYRKRADALRSIDLREQRVAELCAHVAALEIKIRSISNRLEGPNVRLTIPRTPRGLWRRSMAELKREQAPLTSQALAARVADAMGIDDCYALRQRAVQALRRANWPAR